MAMSKTILVIGGSGMLGEPVARALADAGHRVRVLSRNPDKTRKQLGEGFDYVKGDVEDERSLESALMGCDGAHVNLMGGPKPEDFDRVEHLGTARIAKVAARLGIKHLTYLSGAPVCEQNLHDPGTKAKYDAEKAIQRSGVPYTIFRVSWLMESLDLFVRGKRALVIGHQAHPVRWVAADDYAQMVVRAYELPEARNKTFFVVGPEALNKPEALRVYTEIARPEVKVTRIPVRVMKVAAALSFDTQLRTDVRRLAFYDTIGDDFGDPTEANRVFGAPKTTLREWSRRRGEVARSTIA